MKSINNTLRNGISKLFFIVAIVVMGVFAQPSHKTMLAKVKSEFDKDLISHKLIGPGGVDREFRNGFWVDIFSQPFEIVQKSEYPQFPTRYQASLRYQKSGSEWIFEQFTVGSVSYLNVPPPEWNHIFPQLTQKPEIWLENAFNYVVGDLERISLAQDPIWYFQKPTQAAFYIQVTYAEKSSNTELTKSEYLYRITAKRENLSSPWIVKSGSQKTDAKRVIAKSKYSEAEIKAMKSLGQLAEEKSANQAMNALPKVPAAPLFQSEQQLFYYIHEKIRTAPDGPTAEAYLMTVVDASCFENGSTVFFKGHHAEWINYLVENLHVYQDSYCEYPGVKHQQEGNIEFLNKNFTSFVTMTAKPAGNTWKIVDFRFTAQNQAMVEQMKGDLSKCQPKPDLTVKEKVSYQVGDKVNVKFSNGTRACVIDKRDPNMETRYFVKIEGDASGRGYWVEDAHISK